MFLNVSLEAEGRALIPAHQVVLACSDHSEGSGLLQVDGIDGLAVSNDVTHRGARVPQENVAKPYERREGGRIRCLIQTSAFCTTYDATATTQPQP